MKRSPFLVPTFTDAIGHDQADAYLSCIEGFECDPEAGQCQNEAIAWGSCLAF